MIVYIGITQHFFAVLHGKSDYCVLIIHHQILWKKPCFASLHGDKSIKTAPCKLQGLARDSFMARKNALWTQQEGSSEKWVSVSSLPQQSWANQFLSQVSVLSFVKCNISYHCLPFLFRLFALQGNVYCVLCIYTMASKAILFRAALPAVNTLTPIPLVCTIWLTSGTHAIHAIDSLNFIWMCIHVDSLRNVFRLNFLGMSAHFAGEWIHSRAVQFLFSLDQCYSKRVIV